MAEKSLKSELARALARSDVTVMTSQIDAYAKYHKDGANDWPDDVADDFDEIMSCYMENPDKALAYVVLGANRSDDADFVNFLGCGPLEDVLREPSEEMIKRVVSEARRSPRFRWLLNSPFKVAVSEAAWGAIKQFRVTGPHEEPSLKTMPPRD